MPKKWICFSVTIVLTIATFIAFTGCISDNDDESGAIQVIVTIVPQVEMAEAIGGDLVEVTVMVPEGESPHTFAPTPSQLKKVAKAEVYFKVGSGVEFELNHLHTLEESNKNMEIVDCSKGVTLLEMGEEHDHDDDHDDHDDDHNETDDHDHDDDHNETRAEDKDHDHEGDDPHIWCSPSNAKKMVQNMYDGLVKVDPDNKATYEANRDTYLKKLDDLISEIHTKLDPHADEEFLVYHPAWGYFAHEFGLHQIAIEDKGKEPGPAGVAAIIDQAKEHGITVIFVSPQFDTSSGETIAKEIGGKVVFVDPLSSDYIDNLKDVAKKMEEGLV